MDQKTQADAGIPTAMIVFLVLALGTGMLFSLYGQALADHLLFVCRLLCQPLGLVSPRYEAAAAALANIAPGQKDLSFAWQALNAIARWYVLLLCLPLSLWLLYRGRSLSVADIYRRSLTMQTLLKENVPFAPCIAPALNWPGGILAEPLDKGPWRAGRQPLQLACEQGLLLKPADPPVRVQAGELLAAGALPREDSPWLGLSQNGLQLDRKRTHAFYAAQLSCRWRGFQALPPYLQKLAGAWALFAVDEKDLAQKLMDEMSLSFRGPEPAKKARFVRTPPFFHPAAKAHGCLIDAHMDKDARKAVSKALAEEKVRAAVRRHGIWQDPALLSLYELARTRGVLASAEFIWLRPVNRQLYYLCNNMGRRTAWPETAGAWAHYQAENALAQLDSQSGGIEAPHVTEAVNALELALYEDGWISPDKLSEEVRQTYALLGQDD